MKTTFLNPVSVVRSLVIAAAVGTFGLAIYGQQSAEAFPKFAKKENKPCAYCHVNPKGAGPRTAAGKWYGEHDNSFVGYVPAAGTPAPKPSPKATPKVTKKPAPKPTPKVSAKK